MMYFDVILTSFEVFWCQKYCIFAKLSLEELAARREAQEAKKRKQEQAAKSGEAVATQCPVCDVARSVPKDVVSGVLSCVKRIFDCVG